MPTKHETIHCKKCEGSGIKKVTFATHTKYRCKQCKLVVNSKTLKCKNHPGKGSYPTEHPETTFDRKCAICAGTGEVEQVEEIFHSGYEISPGRKNEEIKQNNGMTKVIDSLQKTIRFDRKLLQEVKKLKKLKNQQMGHPISFVKVIAKHIEKYQPKKAIKAFREAFLPDAMVDEIALETECDKWAEKTKLSNIMMWTLAFFLQNKTEELAIKEIANASASLLGRELSKDDRAVSNNALGVRLEKTELINALEMMLQLCSAQLGIQAFEDTGSYVNIYYDWFYFVKSGDCWEVCKQVGRTQESKAIKIGIGIEWESKALWPWLCMENIIATIQLASGSI